jgi:hypothetical protein
MRGPAGPPPAGKSFRIVSRVGFDRDHGQRFLNNSGNLFLPFFYPWDDYDYGPAPETTPEAQQVIVIPQQAEPPAAPVVSPAPALILENHAGHWVRLPTGNEIPAASQPAKTDSTRASPSAGAPPTRSEYAEVPQASLPTEPLPPAVIIYRDGRTEELAKYMIHGNDLYTTSDYYGTGSWTRKIPLTDVDIPASLKINRERGTKFNLPSGPNEVVLRF